LVRTGNGLANRISGNVLDNVIDGGLGNDTLNGGEGRDTASFASWDALTQGQFESIRIDLVQGTAQRSLPMFNNFLIESDTLTGFEHVRQSDGNHRRRQPGQQAGGTRWQRPSAGQSRQ
jgi:Ca2+-binding RTX toxin-like protein